MDTTKKETIDTDNSGEVIDVEIYTKGEKIPPIDRKYRVKIGDAYYIFDRNIVTGKEILEKSGNTPVECYTLYQKFKHCDFEKIDLNEKIDLAKPGIEHFTVKPPEVFYYTVDSEPETTDQKTLTPNKILELAGIKPVTDFYLIQILPDGSQIKYIDNADQPIKMQCPAMEFISVSRGPMTVS